jgi:CRISPR-associated protein (TIGR03986 family)
VTCWVVRVEHRSGHFSFWGVRQIFRRGQVRGTPDADCRQVDGHVCVTGPNIDRKHDERVFFTDQPDPICIPLGPAERRAWQTLIENYQQEHAEEIRRGRDGPPALQNSRWSRHVAGGSAEAELCDGTLCYATVQKANGRWTLQALYPVMISRRLFEAAPQALLPPKGRPAMALSELSPADRVFGWVNQNGHGAYRGNLRIGPVSCVTADAVTRFDPPGLPLAILGQPKPQQARFYAAASENGEAQAHGLSKSAAGYQKGKGLRGRKVYPHHGVPNSHWANPTEDRTQQAADGLFQEYRRPRLDGREQRDDQNRSLLGWVRPGAEFEFDLHVTNLSRVELGALVWLLALPPQHYHRLGGGKPLGFGSVRLDLLRSDVRTGEQWKEHYASLDGDNPVAQDLRAIQTAFEEAVAEAYGRGKTWREVPFLAAFLRAAAGFADKLPVHYPRKRTAGHAKGPVPPNPQGLSYEWFVANDAVGRHPSGPHYALPDLAADTGLPLLE